MEDAALRTVNGKSAAEIIDAYYELDEATRTMSSSGNAGAAASAGNESRD